MDLHREPGTDPPGYLEGRARTGFDPLRTLLSRGVLLLENGNVTRKHVDVVFPVLHGMYGEDGTVQGLLEMARIPYVGCGVLSSAISMDKAYTKGVVDDLGIRQARYVRIDRWELKDMEDCVRRVEEKLS